MSLTGKAIQYLQNKYPNISFIKDIILQDDGEGPYVKYWGLGDPQPTEEELNQEGEKPTVPVETYPTVDEQLGMLYNDMKYGTNTFVETIDKFKAK